MAPRKTSRAAKDKDRINTVDWEDVGRWRRISTRIWGDAKFRALTAPPPSGRYLFFHLTTSPLTTSIPGLFRAREGGMADELGWPLEGFREAFREVSGQGLAEADWKAGVIWLPNGLKYDPPQSPNVILGWRKLIKHEIPDCDLKQRAIASLIQKIRELTGGRPGWEKALLTTFGEAFPEAFREGLPPPLPKPIHHPPSTILHPDLLPPPPVVAAVEDALHFFRWAQRQRCDRRGGISESDEAPDFRVELASWYLGAMKDCGGDRRRLEVAWQRFLDDPWAGSKNYAWAIFTKVWRTRAPGELPPPEPEPEACILEGCDRPQTVRGCCATHAAEFQRWASARRTTRRPQDYPETLADPVSEWVKDRNAEDDRLFGEWKLLAHATPATATGAA